MNKTTITLILLLTLILTGLGMYLNVDMSLEGQPGTGLIELLRGDEKWLNGMNS